MRQIYENNTVNSSDILMPLSWASKMFEVWSLVHKKTLPFVCLMAFFFFFYTNFPVKISGGNKPRFESKTHGCILKEFSQSHSSSMQPLSRKGK